LQSQDLNNLYIVLKDVVSKSVITNKNRAKSWRYGYDPKYDFVVISKTGEIGDIISVNGLKIALPKVPKNVYSRSKSKSEQYWQPFAYDKSLSRIKSIFQWHDAPDQFKSKWVDYIEEEFDRREEGFWFMNNGKFGVSWKAGQMKVYPETKKLSGYSFVDESDDEDESLAPDEN